VSAGEQAGILEGTAEAPHGPGVGRQGRQVEVVPIPGDKADGAGVGGHEARQHVEDGCLAGAVGAHEPHDLARLDVEVHVVDGGHAAESLVQPPGGQRGPGLAGMDEAGDVEGPERRVGPAVGLFAGDVPNRGGGLGVVAGAGQEHRPHQVAPFEDLGGGAREPGLTLFQEHGPVGHLEGQLRRLLHQHDGDTVVP
jgi:hypothetical protein